MKLRDKILIAVAFAITVGLLIAIGGQLSGSPSQIYW